MRVTFMPSCTSQTSAAAAASGLNRYTFWSLSTAKSSPPAGWKAAAVGKGRDWLVFWGRHCSVLVSKTLVLKRRGKRE